VDGVITVDEPPRFLVFGGINWIVDLGLQRATNSKCRRSNKVQVVQAQQVDRH